MKGYLKSSEGVYNLAPKVTTIGREGCDLSIQHPNVDQQHAVIEYSDQEDCFVLQDLNTSQGTYVNDCRVQNAAVRLAPNDMIRFGFNGTQYQLQVDTNQQPPVQQRGAWTQPTSSIRDPYASINIQQGLPYISTITATGHLSSWSTNTTTPSQPLPHPPPTTVRSRPLSAGSRKPSHDRLQNLQGSPKMSPPTPQRSTGGWIGGPINRPGVSSSRSAGSSPTADLIVTQEKEQRILRLNEEVNRLSAMEVDSTRKDSIITQLTQENAQIRNQMAAFQSAGSGDAALTQRLLQLENEVVNKRMEVAALKEQMSKMRPDTQVASDNPANLRHQLNEKIVELNNTKAELERVKKDKNITSGLVTQMQRDMANKDTTISRMTREIEQHKKELREKDVQMSTMTAKVSRLKDNKRLDDEREARDKELISLRHKFKNAENKVSEQCEIIQTLKNELERVKLSIADEKDTQKKTNSELLQSKSQFLDMQRAERLVRVDLEQATKRLERFRNRVVQVTFSTPGIRYPDDEINDDELMGTLKKVVDERTEFQRKLQDLKDSLKEANTTKKSVADSVREMKKHLSEMENRIRDNGHLSTNLKQEVSLLQSVTVDESIQWVKDRVLGMMSLELAWEQEIEGALERCGVNVKVSSDEPAKHISNLYAKWESAIGDKDKMTSQLNLMEQQNKADRAVLESQLKQDMAEKITDATEKTRLEGEERMNKAIDEIRSAETEKRENALDAERKKLEEVQANMETLRASFMEKQEEDKEKMDAANSALQQLEEYKKLEEQLREEIAQLENQKQVELDALKRENEESDKNRHNDVSGYKEQIKQHSVTICAMEERLAKVMKKNKDLQSECSTLKKTVQELKNRPAPKPAVPLKPKVVIQKPAQDVFALNQLIVNLRRDNSDLKKQMQGQQDLVTGLRRDLAGASARLTDIRGEMSESQKEELERNKISLGQREKEHVELRQQMAKLTHIIDKQSNEIKDFQLEVSKQKAQLAKFKNLTSEQDNKLKTVEEQLTKEQLEQRRSHEVLENEGRITSELTSIGAQCRGERHSQVIERQREGLAELRQRIKGLEVANMPVPTPDQALQQVVLLKKELAEMRADKALNDDKHFAQRSTLDRQVDRARGIVSSSEAEMDSERSAHRETLHTLEDSEASYLELLRAMASCVEMEECGGLRSLAHIPPDERIRLMTDRSKACELIATRIKVLRERINRKDELLQNYEGDLAKMRQAQTLADLKHSQVESLSHDIRNRTDETQYLRESLNRTRDRLEQEKRLNTAIKQKKTFHLENERGPFTNNAKHNCPPEDLTGRSSARRRVQSENKKRRSYEVKALKNELASKEQELCETTTKLVNLETSFGLDSQQAIFE